jgi:5-methyltetrahydropteroyltriglutamate--homocysteine methyltransferase
VKRSDSRILTTHVGSLIRPPELIELGKGSGGERRYRDALARATEDVVRRQLDAGVDIVNDGEYGKSSWSNYVLDRLTGFAPSGDRLFEATWLGRDRIRFREFMKEHYPRGATSAPGHLCVGPITYTGHEAIRRNIADLTAGLAAAGAADGFLTAVAPASTGYEAANEYYASDREYVFAIADALREEYLEIVNAGLTLQIDDAVLANMYDEITQQSAARYREWAEVRVEALNHALRDIPADRVRFHTCYSINMGPRVHDMELRDIVDLVLEIDAGAYSFEAANPRHEHEWRVWEDAPLPDDKILIPGVISHSTVLVEHPDTVAERILRYAGVVGRERVIAGSDCGFASFAITDELDRRIVWAKLEALGEGARRASEQLW